MKTGDIVFCKGRIVARAARDIRIQTGCRSYFFAWPVSRKAMFSQYHIADFDLVGAKAEIRCIFNMGDFHMWELIIPPGADPDVTWDQIGLFKPYTEEPSTSPAGVVAAIDIVLQELRPIYAPHLVDVLKSMRTAFAHRAGDEKVDP